MVDDGERSWGDTGLLILSKKRLYTVYTHRRPQTRSSMAEYLYLSNHHSSVY
ncbi:hypothetical protein PILCRDRAFT_819718 [Piloderma croceum F 1598]|uniref:Uncharacterized protein n=1 Tax=Piloderma croceum (strain F 1598) TaxID=765440 RepID=A0A0C3FWR7_PILCF|nr:hypothetical protein PILCRDRAFT_819718 [Piloderma croceum F 1598]